MATRPAGDNELQPAGCDACGMELTDHAAGR